MSSALVSPPRTLPPPIGVRSIDRRRHVRVPLVLAGRFMRENRQEHRCKSIDASVGGLSIASPVPVDVDERIIVYLDQLGGLEGGVVRLFDCGFALRLQVSRQKREKLASQLTWLANRHDLGGVAERRHERSTPRVADATLTLSEGLTVSCRLIDVSLSGASVMSEVRPPLGTQVMLAGALPARVVRHHDSGVALEFTTVQTAEYLDRYFG